MSTAGLGAARRHRHGAMRTAAKAVALGLAIGLALWGVLDASGLRARPAYCIGIALAAVGLGALVRAVLVPPTILGQPQQEMADTARPYTDLYFLEYRLSWGSVERARYEQRVRPLLVRLVGERLRQRHGIDPDREPAQARRIVGDQLWQLITAAPDLEGKPPSPREVAALVEAIERI